jgi:hypothetical protein
MKRIIQSIAVIVLSGLILVGCQTDKVAPKENGGAPSLAGAAGDPHPALDTVCQTSDTLFMVREDNGSFVVDKCFGLGGVLIACPTGQMPWGYLIAREGYIGTDNVVDFDFSMAPGWYCDFNRWKFGLNNNFLFDLNGIPVIGNDWSTEIVNPVQNKWKIRIPVNTMPAPSFEIALNVSAVRLNLFGAVTAGSTTSLWGKNRNWNVTSGSAQSTSPWLMHFTPFRCMEPAPVPTDSTISGGACNKCESSSYLYFTTTNPNCVDVNSCKELSNVVLRDCNGVDYKYDGLSGHDGSFCHPSGLPIATVWVKSGCFQSNDGPGYGRRFENPFDVCN